MSRKGIILLVAISMLLLLAIAWDIIEEIPEKGALRSAGRAFLAIGMPAFWMVRAVRNEWKQKR